ncbi:VOC family protein [Paracoccus sp. Z330]|uniref:VOC family protein n=1 Tax=Paracoccus onchidii TaxID=3017813 RepID=A0ABT4ZBW5_9RHOB|nr:VOC family protein [Paracoccus onchidii]MDB6176750.1 VOC family protein [Paracoccus onchidii]
MSACRQRVTLITLGVDDLDRAREFYRKWGWQPHPQSQDSVVFYQMNGAVLGLFGRAELAKDQGRPDAVLGTGAMTLAQNCPDNAQTDAVFQAAIDAGAKCLKRPESVFWGGYSGYFADPDGHVWEIATNPFWPLDDDGGLTLPEASD